MDSKNATTALSTTNAPVVSTTGAGALPPLVPWRDPQTIPPSDLAAYIQNLERACLAEPESSSLRTCLGMAYAVNYDVDKSMAALQTAVAIDPENFWARLKYAELHYRLRVLNRAEEETLGAVALASNAWQLSLARKQLHEIRALKTGCVRNVEWTKSLTTPALVLSAMVVGMFVAMLWR